MTAFDAYERICSCLSERPRFSVAYEYEYVFGFRMRPSELLCVVKSNGDVVLEEDLPDKIAPKGPGEMVVIGKNW